MSKRLKKLTDKQLAKLVEVGPHPAFAEAALALYSRAGSFSSANALAPAIRQLVPHMTKKQTERLIQIIVDNGEIRGSFELESVVSALGRQTHVPEETFRKRLVDAGVAEALIDSALLPF